MNALWYDDGFSFQICITKNYLIFENFKLPAYFKINVLILVSSSYFPEIDSMASDYICLGALI